MNITSIQRLGLLAAVLMFSVATGVAAQDKVADGHKTGLQLFGVALKGASRDQLREVFKKNGLKPTREDNDYWVDQYDAQGVLESASEFSAGYVSETHAFAFAQYTFKSFMDTAQVSQVVELVTTKYGPPTSRRGNAQLGPVNVHWGFPNGMSMEVWREWPDTTTYLTFYDTAAHAQMEAEIEHIKQARQAEKSASQSNAF